MAGVLVSSGAHKRKGVKKTWRASDQGGEPDAANKRADDRLALASRPFRSYLPQSGVVTALWSQFQCATICLKISTSDGGL